jgi:hypothetical protein
MGASPYERVPRRVAAGIKNASRRESQDRLLGISGLFDAAARLSVAVEDVAAAGAIAVEGDGETARSRRGRPYCL